MSSSTLSMRPLQPNRTSAASAPTESRTMGRCLSRVSNMARRDFSGLPLAFLSARAPSMDAILQQRPYHQCTMRAQCQPFVIIRGGTVGDTVDHEGTTPSEVTCAHPLNH